MIQPLRLTLEEQSLLKRLDNSALQFLSEIEHNKNFTTLSELINLLIDQEKNMFFGEDESKYENSVWQSRHAFARGGIAKLIMLMHIIVGASVELHRREEERKKKK